jgi:hypothetical protein
LVKESIHQGQTGCAEYGLENRRISTKMAAVITDKGQTRIPTQALQFKPKRRRKIECQKKRKRDNFTLKLMDQALSLTLQSS